MTRMNLPFTQQEFFGVFSKYNDAIWPGQLMLLIVALAAVGFAVRGSYRAGVVVSGVLALLWAWMAVAYHLLFFAQVNPGAYAFAAVFGTASFLFMCIGMYRGKLVFDAGAGRIRFACGLALIGFGLAIYPVWSWYSGHRYPAMPTFGLPCPTALFTIGILALATRPPRSLLVVPILWCLIGGQAAWLLDVPQDLSLFVAAGAGLLLLLGHERPVLRQAAIVGGWR